LYITLVDGHPLTYCQDIYSSNGIGIGDYLGSRERSVSYWEGTTVGFDFAQKDDYVYGDTWRNGKGKKWTLEEGDFRIQIADQVVMVHCDKTVVWDTPNID
jgi:hypothetical protein